MIEPVKVNKLEYKKTTSSWYPLMKFWQRYWVFILHTDKGIFYKRYDYLDYPSSYIRAGFSFLVEYSKSKDKNIVENIFLNIKID